MHDCHLIRMIRIAYDAGGVIGIAYQYPGGPAIGKVVIGHIRRRHGETHGDVRLAQDGGDRVSFVTAIEKSQVAGVRKGVGPRCVEGQIHEART